MTSSGELVTVSRGDPDFDGLVVGLGALGAVTRVTLDVEPAYEVRQRVFEGLGWLALYEHFDEIVSSGDSVSVFTRWGQAIDQVWVKSRVTGAPEEPRRELFGATAATAERHPIPGLDPASSTPQLGAPGLWSDRLPHFRIGFTPSTGEEIQSEYLVPRAKAVAAIEAVRGLARTIRPLLLVGEIRAIAADRLWMSPQYGQDTIGIHFHLEARARRRLAGARRARGRAGPVRRAPALGQAVHRGGQRDRAALRAPARLPVSRRAVRPARRVSQRLARASNARQPVATVRPPCGYRVVLFLRLPAAAGSLAGAAVPFVEDLLARRSSAFGPPAPRIAFETSLTWLFPCAGDA